MLQPWAGLCKAEGERPGLPCNLGQGTGVSACREGKEGEKKVAALVGMCLQGLLCRLSLPHLPSPPRRSVGQRRQRSLEPDWGHSVALGWLVLTQPPGTSSCSSDLKTQTQQTPVTQWATPVRHTSGLFKELDLLVCLQLVHSGVYILAAQMQIVILPTRQIFACALLHSKVLISLRCSWLQLQDNQWSLFESCKILANLSFPAEKY